MINLTRRTLLVGLGTVALSQTLSRPALATPFVTLAPKGAERMSHKLFDELLKRYVRPDAERYNRVDYRSFGQSGRDRLNAYLELMVAQDPARLSVPEAHAYWINLYNAKTLDIVLDVYPVSSIRSIDLGGGGLFKRGPWSKKIVSVRGVALSLDNIEHDIVRALFSDPMSHYGLNCASYSCPNLATRAYTGDTIDSALAQGAREYVNHRRGVAVSRDGITASKIYDWYAEDFGGRGRVKGHWKAYAAPDLAEQLDRVEIRDYAYDWSLNDV